MKRKKFYSIAAILVMVLIVMSSCSDPSASPVPSNPRWQDTTPPQTDNTEETVVTPPKSDDGKKYVFPEVRIAKYHEELTEGFENARIDISSIKEGYVAASAKSENRLKFQVKKEGITYNYDLPSDGTPGIFPLQSGDGTYTFRIMENVTGSSYAEVYSTTIDVNMNSEFEPFLRNNSYVDYSVDSECVKTAQELTMGASDSVMVVSRIYDFICKNINYDKQKATTVSSGYIPYPDSTLATGMGICFDYAALAAAMLRSLGIPTKMIFGNVEPDGLYHAWNMFYTKETGWITVGFEVTGDKWNRIDLTFSANGADSEFIGNGSNYTDIYYY